MSDYNQQQGQGDRPKKVPGPLDDAKLRLNAEAVNGSRRKPNLRVNFWENNPRIEVRTGVENDKQFGLISAALDLPTFMSLLDIINEATQQTEKWQMRVANQKFKFIRGQRSETPLDDTYIVIGRSENGVIWISVLAYDKERPRIKFEFLPSDFHKFQNHDGTPYDKGKMSQHWARGWVRTMQEIIPFIFQRDYEYIDYAARKAERQAGGGGGNRGGYGGGGGGNGGGYNNRNNNGGGYQQRGGGSPQGSASTSGGSDAGVESWGGADDLDL